MFRLQLKLHALVAVFVTEHCWGAVLAWLAVCQAVQADAPCPTVWLSVQPCAPTMYNAVVIWGVGSVRAGWFSQELNFIGQQL